MNADAHIRVVLEVFAAIEQRDAARFQAHTHPGVTICWPPSLPWNAWVPGRPDEDGHHALSWLEMWAPLQPTAAERQMDPEVIAAADDWVVGTTPRTCAAYWQMTLSDTCTGAARSPVTITVTRKSWAISGKITECWLVPFDQYLFDELWS